MPAVRPPEAIHADIGNTIRTLAALHAELAAASGTATSERILEIKQAADVVGWSETTMRRNIVRYHRDHPDRPAWAVQFGGKKKSKWSVYVDRLKAIIASGEPFDK